MVRASPMRSAPAAASAMSSIPAIVICCGTFAASSSTRYDELISWFFEGEGFELTDESTDQEYQEALKKDGQIISYKVITTEAHGRDDWNIMLMTEYRDLATMEANQAKEDNLMQAVIGTDEKQMQGYRDRLQIREVLEGRTGREIVLEPRR